MKQLGHKGAGDPAGSSQGWQHNDPVHDVGGFFGHTGPGRLARSDRRHLRAPARAQTAIAGASWDGGTIASASS